MSFVSDQAALANQCPIDPQLPELTNENFVDLLTDVLKDHANNINNKSGGLYGLEEKIAFKVLFKNGNPQSFRPIYRKCFDLVQSYGDIAGSASISFPHMINVINTPLVIRCTCQATDGRMFEVSYSNFYIDNINIYLTNPYTIALKSAIVVLEYTKD